MMQQWFKRATIKVLDRLFNGPSPFGPVIDLADDKELPEWVKIEMKELGQRLDALAQTLDAYNVAAAGVRNWIWRNPRFDDAE